MHGVCLEYHDEDKQRLLRDLLKTTSRTFDLSDPIHSLDDTLTAARIFCLSVDELYFLDKAEDLREPLNHRNEAAALSLIQQRLAGLEGDESILKQLHEYCENLWPQFHHEDLGLDDREGVGTREAGEKTTSFLSWAKGAGIVSSDLTVGTFPPLGIRGCYSERDIQPGTPHIEFCAGSQASSH